MPMDLIAEDTCYIEPLQEITSVFHSSVNICLSIFNFLFYFVYLSEPIQHYGLIWQANSHDSKEVFLSIF